MNEIQIIQRQLATERANFSEVAAVCAAHLGSGGEFAAACTDYFAFAVTRFEPQTAQRLAAQLTAGLGTQFLQDFTTAARQHFERLDGLLTRNLPVTQWRALSSIDADSIFAERTCFSRVKATIPT
jgi:hypothetical protein